MCLRKLNKVRKTEGYGWKLFVEGNYGNLFSTDCVPRQERGEERHENKWLTANENLIETQPDGKKLKYLSGWHIFKTKKDAIYINNREGLVLRKVEYREAKFQGPVCWWPYDYKITTCVVAKQIRIIPEKTIAK